MSRIQCPNCGSNTGYGEVVCFKCGVRNSEYTVTPGFFINNESRKQILQLRDDIVLSPKRFSPEALRWLYSAGIFDETIVNQKIAYCTEINKVLVPAFDGSNNLMFYQLRRLADRGDDNKYTSYGRMSNYTINYNDHDNDTLVIVEDHLSAIRLRETHNVCALSGTSVNWETCLKIVKYYNNVIFWLDPDQPGREAMYKSFNKLKYHSSKHAAKLMFSGQDAYYYNFTKVDSEEITKDPKFYLTSEIKDIVKNKVLPL
jgi:hypothetical protein